MPDSIQKVTGIRKVLAYYPQRVQLLAMSLLNFVFISIAEFTVREPSVVFVGAANALVLALLVFFYGEHVTHSKQAVEDFFNHAASAESEVEYEAHGIDDHYAATK